MMKSRSSIAIVAIATLLGLFLANGINGWLGALILGAISAAGAAGGRRIQLDDEAWYQAASGG